jgi:hypothetical protein
LVLEGCGGHGLEGRISIGQREQVQGGVMEKLGEEEFVGVFDFLCDFSWEGEEKDDESYKMVERGRVR